MAATAWIATRKGLFPLLRQDGDWRLGRPHFLGEPVSSVLAHPSGRVYAALRLGHFGVKLHRSDDGGATWREYSAPVYPEKPVQARAEDNWSIDQIWTLEFAAGADPNSLWAGTIPGGVFKSTDGGESWALNCALWGLRAEHKWTGGGYDDPGAHSIVVDPRDARHVSIAVSTGGVWQSFDGGESWRCTATGMRAAYMPPELSELPTCQDVHRLAQCAAAPDVQWIQHHNARYHSTDGGNTWRDLGATVSAFGFAVVAHPLDPRTAWFVPAVKDEVRVPVDGRMVVTRTRDGGESFEVLSRGLPQSGAYDLVYRHGLDIDSTGEKLLLGSTTGSLWITENGGDDWQTLSAHLPPINAVRFV